MLVLIHGSIPGWLNMAAYLLSKGVCTQLLKVGSHGGGFLTTCTKCGYLSTPSDCKQCVKLTQDLYHTCLVDGGMR